MNIIFDLDGTLIDSSERMYKLFCCLVSQCKLTKKEYWDLKRDKVNHKELLKMRYPEIEFSKFNKEWMRSIEKKYYLDMDQNYPDTLDVLYSLDKSFDLYLLTARQSKTGLYDELKRLSLFGFFRKILLTEGSKTKEELLCKVIKDIPDLGDKRNIFVSDMGNDILLGNKIGYSTVAISHGFMSREKLAEYKPGRIIDELSEFLS
ncbi:MAG: HAD family hydrolase [Lachnospiraceae bacterium]|jgi:phosphoglycolate phosphatase|nr:HAD family hydrolase [Lachnospiraceae bacterium]